MTGFPWAQGDLLLANDLNAAIANAGSESGGAVNVLDFGADPTGVADSAPAINAAAAVVSAGSTRHKAVYLPTGTYRVNSQINLTACQAFYGDSRGSSVLTVNQHFDTAATAVIYCTNAGYDAGPVLRDFGITFAQPSDQGSRANFKTLAAGGTSATGGSGVMYPWAIAAGSSSFRVQIIRVRIAGAWDGITSNNNNAVFYLDDVEMGALDCGLSLGEGTGILDTCHIVSYHFWAFGLTGSLQTVMADGLTIAARFGEIDGLDVKGFMTLWGRLVFTAAAATGWYAFTNVFLDTSATLEVVSVKWLQITNLYSTAGPSLLRPLIELDAGAVQIANFYATSTLAQPILSVRGADVTVTGFAIVPYNTATPAVFVDGGTLRLNGGHIYPGTASAYTAALVWQGGTGSLKLADVDLNGAIGSSGVAAQFSVDNVGNVLGNVTLGSGWSNSVAAMVNGVYGPFASVASVPVASSATPAMDGTAAIGVGTAWARADHVHPSDTSRLALSGGTMTGGLHFGATAVTGTDMSRHIELYSGYAGFNVTAGAMNAMIGGAIVMSFVTAGAGIVMPQVQVSTSYANDAAAAAGGVPLGGLYRNGSAVMVRVT